MASLAAVRLALRRNVLALVAWVLVCNGLAAADLLLVKPDFIASVQLVLQPRHSAHDGPEDLRKDHQIALDGEQAETQLRVIRSERLLRSVFTALDLAHAPEIQGGQAGLWSGLARALHRLAPGARPVTDEDRAFRSFSERVRSRRLGLSYVIDISYRALSGRQAARVANAVAAAYVGDRVASAIADARAGGPYLRRRVAEMVGETLTTGEALRAGTVPATYLADADVRLLGPAAEPLSKAFPTAGPVLMLGSGFGLLSGALLVLLQDRLGATIRSRQHLRRRTGLDCLAVVCAGRDVAWADLVDPVRAIRAALPAAAPRVGFVAWKRGTGVAILAAAFARASTEAGVPTNVVDLEQSLDSPGGATPSSGPRDDPDITPTRRLEIERAPALAVALPPLREPFSGLGLLPLLDGTVLVIEARRTTYAELRSALRAMATARVVPTGLVMMDSGLASRGTPRAARGLVSLLNRKLALTITP